MLSTELHTTHQHTNSGVALFTCYDDMVIVAELSDMLKIGRNTAYELVRAGIVPSIKIGRQFRISKQAVIEYISKNSKVI